MTGWILLAAVAFGQPAPGPWSPFGPGGGTVLSIAVDLRDAWHVFAVAGAHGMGTLYRSTDAGVTWRALAGPDLRVVAIDPENSSTIYAGGDKLLRSVDGGATWTDVSPSPPGGRAYIQSLAVAPGGVVLAGAGQELLRSADAGASWTVVATDGTDIRWILVNPAQRGSVYRASLSAVAVSRDAGATWTPAARPPVAGDLEAFALAPSSPNTLYAMAVDSLQVFRSDDGAATWRAAGSLSLTGSPFHQVLLVDPRSPEWLFAATEADLFQSLNGGKSWTSRDAGLPRLLGRPLEVVSLASPLARPDFFFAGTADWGIATTRNGGAQWRLGPQNGLNAAAVQLLKLSPLAPDTVYLALGEEGTRSFRSADGGHTWSPFARAISQNGLNDLAWEPGNPKVLYAANGQGIWKSADAGSTWNAIVASQTFHLAVLDRWTLIADPGCGLRRSRNGGRTWKQTLPCFVNGEDSVIVGALWADPKGSATLYAHATVTNGSSHFAFAVYRSRDGGVTWQTLPIAQAAAFAPATSDFRILYAFDPFQHRLSRSADGGDHWAIVDAQVPDGVGALFQSMAVDAADPDTVYLGGGPQVLISHDGGATFMPVAAPFEATKRTADRLWTDLRRPGRVYAEASSGGLFEGDFR
ncbi:MAG TPA: hypothetical protein VGH73_11280 [Thermoanaerobaculia bacterium]